MKRTILGIILILAASLCKAQMLNYWPIYEDSAAVNSKSVFGVDKGLWFSRSFTDTAAINAYIGGRLKGIPGIQVRVVNNVYMRSNDLSKWLLQTNTATPIPNLQQVTDVQGRTTNDIYIDHTDGSTISLYGTGGTGQAQINIDNVSGEEIGINPGVISWITPSAGLINLQPANNSGSSKVIIIPNASGTIALRATDSTASPTNAIYQGTDGLFHKTSFPTSINPTNNLFGTIVNQNSFPNTTGYTNNGTTVSVVSNKLQFTGGANDFAQTLALNQVRNTERWLISSSIKVGTKTSTSYGFGLGQKSINLSNPNNIVAKFNMITGGGTIDLYMGNNSSVGTSSTALTFSVNDYIVLTLQRDGDLFTATARNITAGGTEVTTFYRAVPYAGALLPNAGQFSVYSFGGTFILDSLHMESREQNRPQIIIIGDSKLQGYYTSQFEKRDGSLIQQKIKGAIISSGNSETTHEVSARLQEIINFHPVQVLLGIGANDVRGGISSAVYIARYDSIVTALTNAGIGVINYLPFYEGTGGVDQTPLLNHIISTYPTTYIDTYFPIKDNPQTYLYSDSIHPNDAGNKLIYNQTVASGLINGLSPSYIANGNIAGTGIDGDNYTVLTAPNTRFNFQNYSGIANTIESVDNIGTTKKRFDLRGSEYHLLLGNSNIQGINLSTTGTLDVPQDGDHTFGTTNIFHVKTNATLSNELLAGDWIGSTTTNTVIVPAINGTGGAKTQLGYFSSVNGWTSGVELTNTSSAFGNLLLMKGGGNVGIGTPTPTDRLMVGGVTGGQGITIDGANSNLTLSGTSSPRVTFNNGFAANILYTPTYDIVFNLAGRSNMLYLQQSNGFTGINNSSPAQQLDVTGTIRQSAVTSSLLKTNSSGDLIAAVSGTDYAPAAGVTPYTHNISTPTTGGTVTLIKNQYNVINPAGALLTLTINLPSSPANNDVVYIKFTQNITTVTYGNGTVVDGITAPTAGGLTVLVYDAGTTSWY